MKDGTRLAVVDLGSNSYHLEIGHIEHGQFCRSEYLKETIRQGNGFDDERNLTSDAMQKGWDCLARFSERLTGFNSSEVRAVATQTLREARNRDDFLMQANNVLGFPIDVISGREEARLVYQGVAQSLQPCDERRLVVDIGGRSTELILGQGCEPKVMESYRVGSVIWSTRYFADNKLTKQSFLMAEIAAKAVLDEAITIYKRKAWDVAYGSAGTVGAVCDVLTAAGWPADSVSRDGLNWLQDALISAQSTDRIKLQGLREDRRIIIGGGLSILRALFDLLQINHMKRAVGGLRHGLLFDLTGEHEDVCTKSVRRLESRFGTDSVHGLRVGRVANHLFRQLQNQAVKAGDQTITDDRLNQKLNWAGQLHEIGSKISHSDLHKHGAYILENSDAVGFGMSELHKLGQLVLGHRGKLRRLEVEFEDQIFVQQLLCLRLAVILCHARCDPDLKGIELKRSEASDSYFSLSVREDWGKNYPQSSHLLREEVLTWRKTVCSLTLTSF